MQHPLRELVRSDNPAQAEILDEYSARFFIPGSWSGRRVLIKPAPGVVWSAVRTDAGDPVRKGDWELSPFLLPGTWHKVAVEGGGIRGAVLESSSPLYIDRLEAWYDPPEELSIRVRLGRQTATEWRQEPISMLFTLTDERGEQVGQQDVEVGVKTVELAVALPIAQEPGGHCRLKAALCLGQEIIDDARIDVTDFE